MNTIDVSYQEAMLAVMGKETSFEAFKKQALFDYKLSVISRQTSLLSRREVLTGKAKFGITGDGKELPQIALAKVFEEGDFRSGYYRDQTLMFALNNLTVEQHFAQLYANPSLAAEPHSGGRQMNSHFATHSLNEKGEWNDLTKIKNSAADVSCTAAQMSRAVGLALASKKYKAIKELQTFTKFSKQGQEVTFATIGDASTSEGIFWEAVNAAGVMKIPLAISVWDDGYGISVPTKYQTTKGNISQALSGMEATDEDNRGILIFRAKAWDYVGLCKMYREGIEEVRKYHMPALFHITECTQPQGHSTSGSHERYKPKERLAWEKEHDCNLKMRTWLLDNDIATLEEIEEVEKAAKEQVKVGQRNAWKAFNLPIKKAISTVFSICKDFFKQINNKQAVLRAKEVIKQSIHPLRRDVAEMVMNLLIELKDEDPNLIKPLVDWVQEFNKNSGQLFTTHLHSQSKKSVANIKIIPPKYKLKPPIVNGYEILNACFSAALARDPRVMAFGEDVGKIGDVNQGFAGLQEKYGEARVFDTGIRENTIIGQGIGLAMRGLRPIAEIQYLDYFVYGLQPVVDDLATLHYRTCGRQKAPLLIRTRGHRLEGIWHTGSPMGMLLHAVRGVHLLVPRNMTQAAGFYNTMLQSDEPAIIVECLNGYRLKEKMPSNIGEFTIPLGVPEITRRGDDITIVTYGSCWRVAMQAAQKLEKVDIDCEVIDVQTLLPFDTKQCILQSLKKTNRILFLDEDVPGGATSFLYQQVLEIQGGYQYLDSPAETLTATEHRVPYGSDGDYYCKPVLEDVFKKVYEIMNEVDPVSYPIFY